MWILYNIIKIYLKYIGREERETVQGRERDQEREVKNNSVSFPKTITGQNGVLKHMAGLEGSWIFLFMGEQTGGIELVQTYIE